MTTFEVHDTGIRDAIYSWKVRKKRAKKTPSTRTLFLGPTLYITTLAPPCQLTPVLHYVAFSTRSSAIAEGPRDASCQLKSRQLQRNSAETTYMTSPDQIDGMKLEI